MNLWRLLGRGCCPLGPEERNQALPFRPRKGVSRTEGGSAAQGTSGQRTSPLSEMSCQLLAHGSTC